MNTTLLARTCLALSPIVQVCLFRSNLHWRLNSCGQCRALSSIQRRKAAADVHIELEIPQTISVKSPRH